MNKVRVRIKWHILRSRLYMERLHPKAFILPLLIFSLTTFCLLVYYSFFQTENLWSNWSPATGNAFRFCEMNRMDQLIRQPANTWSNLGYFVVGLFTLTLALHDFKNTTRKSSDNFLVRHPVFSLLFGISALYLFAGSFLFHASLTKTFQKFDQAGLYSVVVMVLIFNLYKIFPVYRLKGRYRSSHGYMVALTFGINFLVFTQLLRININLLFPLMVTLAFITSVYYLLFISREHYFTNYMWAALVILILASVIWILDRTNVMCSPESMLQGHALWHIFTAASIFFIYMYYRSGTVPLAQTISIREERRALRRAKRGW